MQTPTTRTLAALAAVAALAATAAHAATPPPAKVSPAQARAAAVRKVPGTAQKATYEFEDGHWQYAVIVQASKGGLYEVEVNSTTGKVTDTEKTSPAEEAAEAVADKKAAAKKAGR